MPVLVFSVACGQPAQQHTLATRGTVGAATAATDYSNVLLVPVALGGGAPRPVIVDSGAPQTVLAPARWGGEVSRGVLLVDQLTIGELILERVPVLGIDLFGDLPATSFQPTGIVGGDLLCNFTVGLDYHARTVRLGGAPPVDSDARVGFRLEGGGAGAIDGRAFQYPATRVPVIVDVDGISRTLILDTGASFVVLRDGAWQALVADGRARLEGVPIAGAAGTLGGKLARARTITLGGQTVSGAPVLDIGDDLLDAFAAEVGHPVDGLLGGTFLREFLVTLDYPGRTLHLRRYPDRDHVDPDELHQVGLALRSGNVIARVYSGTDAALRDLREGDVLLTIDGLALETDLHAAEQRLHGPVGTRKHLKTDRLEIDVLVDDLLPLLP